MESCNRINISTVKTNRKELRGILLQRGFPESLSNEMVDKAITELERGRFEKCTFRYAINGIECHITFCKKQIRHHPLTRLIKWISWCFFKKVIQKKIISNFIGIV